MNLKRSALFDGLFKNCSSPQRWVLTPEPWFDNHLSLRVSLSNFDQDRNPRSGQVWLLWTPISCSGQMLRNDILRIVESLQLWWFGPYMDNGSSIKKFHRHIVFSHSKMSDFFPLLHFPLSDNNGGSFWFSNNVNHMHLGVIGEN